MKHFTTAMKHFSHSVCAIVFCLVFTAFAAEPLLRLGIISDEQAPASKDGWGLKNTRKAYQLFKRLGIDVIVNNGDLAEEGLKEALQNSLDVFHEVFPENAPRLITVMGNHEFLPTSDTPEQNRQKFKDVFGELNVHCVINGYHIIAISADTIRGDYSSSTDFVQNAMKEAAEDAPGQPIFAFCHHPFMKGLATTDYWGGAPSLDTVFANAPANLIHFSGHTHVPLQDERQIFQGDFTLVSTSSLCYESLNGENGEYNNQMPYQWLCNQALYVEVYSDHLDIIRIQLGETPETSYEIKPENRWRMPIPITKESFTYTAARKNAAVAPQFGLGSQVTVKLPAADDADTPITVSFPAAYHRDFVHTYILKFTASDGSAIVVKYPTDFYLGIGKMATECTFPISQQKLKRGTAYHLDVIPIDSFKKEGLPISTDFTF